MGKFEKLVVLTVLFTATIVLAFSLNRSGEEVEASDPLSGAQRVLEKEPSGADLAKRDPDRDLVPGGSLAEREPKRPDSGPIEPKPTEVAPSPFLVAGGDSKETATPAPTPPVDPAGLQPAAADATTTLRSEPEGAGDHRILEDTRGLRPSFLDEYMTYTVSAGDTWSSLALRFYRDGRFTRNLHLANEDLAELVPGKEILVPVVDLLAKDADARAGDTPASSGPVASNTPSFAKPAAANAAPRGTKKVNEYVVQAGDTLSDISLTVYGTSKRWQDILEANRDLLKKPESLQVGMKLTIPQGESVRRSSSTKPASAPKAAPKSTKKKKVD